MLTTAASAFIGRADELAALAKLLDEGHRVVTLWGAGGMGKTRLALECARAWTPHYAIDLADVTTVEGLVGAVAASLGMAAAVARQADLAAQVGRALSSRRRALVVLDNFEQLVDVGAEIVAGWVGAAPAVRFLVTSRERLRLPGEICFELPPMSLPQRRGSASDAARLFIERAREAGAGPVELDDPRLEQILVELEGIPLAIELAAARLDVLGLDGLIERLPERLGLLSRGARGVAARHATMRAAIAWSWDLLEDRERDALRQLAVFRGGFTLPAAEQVVELDPGPPLYDVLGALREKSLLTMQSAGGDKRFVLFQSVREFALEELLRKKKLRAVTQRHDAHYLEVGAKWGASVDRSGDIHARKLLAAEIDNLLDVHARALAAPPTKDSTARAARALLAADAVLATRASSAMRRRLWEATAAAAEGRVPASLFAAILGGLGRAIHADGDLDGGAAVLDRALALAKTAAASLVATLAIDRGVVAHAKGDLEGARAFYRSALAEERRDDDRRSEARAHGNLAALDHDERKFQSARESYERSIKLARAIGDVRVEGTMTANLGVLEQEEERADRAAEHLEQAIALLERAGDLRFGAIARGNLGMLHLELGATGPARAELERSLEAARAMGDAHTAGLACARLAIDLALLGERAAARERLDEARAELARIGDALTERVVDIGAGFLDLAEPRGRERARAAIAAATRASEGEKSLVDLSDDARSIVRLLTRAIDRVERGAPAEAEPRADALVIGPDSGSFRAPGMPWQTIADHRAAQRVLQRLVTERELRPGSGIDLEAIVEAGWPDQKIRATAAANRAYVVIAWLRKHGLGTVLLRGDHGYSLDPSVPLQRVSRAFAE